MSTPPFIPTVCDHCGQTTDYHIKLDRGSALIVLAIYSAVRAKNENRVHLRNEMEVSKGTYGGNYMGMVRDGYMTSVMIDNVLRPKYHGLVAQVEGGGQGEYLITPKGARFLRGEPVPRTAIIEKRTHHKLRYLDEDDRVTFRELLIKEPMWNIDLAFTERISPDQPTLVV